MGMLGLASALAISTPVADAALPYPLWIGGRESSQGTGTGVDVRTMKLRDPGFSGPQILTFTIHDRALTMTPYIAKQMSVLWHDQVNNTPLFRGSVTDIRKKPVATWVDLQVTCTHASAALDYGQPITVWDSGAHGASDRTMIQSLLANFAMEPAIGCGGNIQALNASMAASLPANRTTLRNAVGQVLAATGVTGAVAYVDNFGYLHTMATGDVTAPYAISDAPNFTTSVPAAIDVLDQGAADVDALYVYGGTNLGSGPILADQCGVTTPRRSPLRWATLDAPQAVDRATMIDAATTEFQRRQNAIAITLVISGDAAHGQFDGWAKGQLLTVTNAALGWSGKQFTVSAVDMDVYNGLGHRRYTITAGTDPVLFTGRLKNLYAQWKNVASSGAAVRGKLGGTLT